MHDFLSKESKKKKKKKKDVKQEKTLNILIELSGGRCKDVRIILV